MRSSPQEMQLVCMYIRIARRAVNMLHSQTYGVRAGYTATDNTLANISRAMKSGPVRHSRCEHSGMSLLARALVYSAEALQLRWISSLQVPSTRYRVTERLCSRDLIFDWSPLPARGELRQPPQHAQWSLTVCCTCVSKPTDLTNH